MNFVGFRNAGSSGRTRVSVSTVATGRAIPRSKNTSPIVTWRRYPIRPWLSAPHTSRGIGDTVPAAASCWRRIRPTWGPLPWVTTTSQPSAAMSAIRSAAARAAAESSSNVSSAPRRSSALPPSATTTRSIAGGLVRPRSGAGPQHRTQHVEQLRRIGQHVEVVAHADRRLADVDHLAEDDRRPDHDQVRLAGVDARVDHGAAGDVGLVLLAFLDRGAMPVEVLELREPLHALERQVAVGHRMTHRHDLPTGLLQRPGHRPGGLRLP